MSDMIVKLYNLKSDDKLIESLLSQGIKIKKVLAPDRRRVIEFIKRNFDDNYVDECKASFTNNPITCYVAVKDKNIIGFACFEATAKDYFGPMGVVESERGKGIGKALLNKSLISMYEMGYGYAIIGWPSKSAIPFYKKAVNATVIDEISSGIYKRMIEIEEKEL